MRHFLDKAFCVRSSFKCVNTACDRYADDALIKQAEKAKLPIGWADLKTSKCGYIPREEEVER